MIDRSKHVPLYIQLKEEIVENIKKEVWHISDKLPTEKEFMEKYGLGRATVRQALAMLVNEGYLFKKQGVGTFVSSKHSGFAFEPFISLEYSLKARGINSTNIIEKKEFLKVDGDLLRELKWVDRRRCFYLKRIRYADGLALAIEKSYFNDEFNEVVKFKDCTASIGKILVGNFNISKVEQLIVTRSSNDEERKKLQLDYGSMVLEMKRWIYIDKEKEPYYYLKFIIPGNLQSIEF